MCGSLWCLMMYLLTSTSEIHVLVVRTPSSYGPNEPYTHFSHLCMMSWRQEISPLWAFVFLFIFISKKQNKRKSSWISTSINLYLCKQQIWVKFKVNIENWQSFVLYCWPLLKAFLSAFRFSFRFFYTKFCTQYSKHSSLKMLLESLWV